MYLSFCTGVLKTGHAYRLISDGDNIIFTKSLSFTIQAMDQYLIKGKIVCDRHTSVVLIVMRPRSSHCI